MSESKVKRYKRYIRYTIQAVSERIKGLDFTMRDTTLINETVGALHGYSKTDESHAKEIFEHLQVDETKSILDVGCGKGAFLREAAKHPFRKIAGLEYVENLADIAKRNLHKLGLEDRVEVFQGDATQFERYDDYNVFYFFNPFDADIMETVILRIFQNRQEDAWIVLHNPVSATVIERYGCVEETRLYDKVKSYETRIYKWEK